jgi:predicted dehydrogenase
MPRKLNVALYGANGHQLTGLLAGHPLADVTAICGIKQPEGYSGPWPMKNSLEELLEDPSTDLICLCSPSRADQPQDAIRCLRAGKHVLAEKPAALTENDLDRVLEAASESGKSFREMGGSAFVQPYRAMRDIVLGGQIGEVVQVFSQKSYPYHDGRPQDENIDGGLLLQVGIHAARWIEHVSGQSISSLQAIETQVGNPGSGALRMAVSLQGHLKNGACATLIANYLNQPGLRHWGNDELRIFGTRGMIETMDSGTRTRLIVGETDHGPINVPDGEEDYFTTCAKHLLGLAPMPLTLDQELHPLRVLLGSRITRPAQHATLNHGSEHHSKI